MTVNRYQEIFSWDVRTGDDLVLRENAFASRVARLARRNFASGWDIKTFYKLILTSATTAATTTAIQTRKGCRQPVAFARTSFPHGRRDDPGLCAVARFLSQKVGGPSVKPYQPDGVWEAVAVRFQCVSTSETPERASTGAHTFWKRSAPPPSLGVFNAPTLENCTVRRERTNTTSGLVTMNDVQYIEAARHLAEQALQTEPRNRTSNSASLRARANARSNEREFGASAYKEYLSFYDSRMNEARQSFHGESKPDPSLSAAELAALTCRPTNFSTRRSSCEVEDP